MVKTCGGTNVLRLISVLEILKNSEKIQIRLKLKSTEDPLKGYRGFRQLRGTDLTSQRSSTKPAQTQAPVFAGAEKRLNS